MADPTLPSSGGRSPEDHVVLIDTAGRPIGLRDRLTVHGPDTPLHLAFSLYVVNSEHEVLITRRALGKTTWPGVWTNTCCGHPRSEEAPADAAVRRLREELGMTVVGLECRLPDFAYTARDASGVLENELCPVFVARPDPGTAFMPNPIEVMDWRWVRWTELRTAVRATPFVFSPWAVEQIEGLADLPLP